MRQRVRITYRVHGRSVYASHLDRIRVWGRAARRAGLRLAYSRGFNPRPRLQVAAALPVGFGAQAEILDLWLAQAVDVRVARRALARTLPEGLEVISVEEVDLAEPPLPTRVQAAEYAVDVETGVSAVEVRHRLEELLLASSLPRQRRGRTYDLRPLVQRLWVEEEQPDGVILGMVLTSREGATGRPDEVVAALGLTDVFFRVQRRRLLLTESSAA